MNYKVLLHESEEGFSVSITGLPAEDVIEYAKPTEGIFQSLLTPQD